MENYLPEGEAKGHENNGKKMYSQGAELEPDQGNLPRGWGFGNICPGRFQTSDYFPCCNGPFIFVISGLLRFVEWGIFSKNSFLSSLPHLYEEFLTLSMDGGAGHMSCLGQ